MKKLLNILFLLATISLLAQEQLTIVIDELPANTEKDTPIFISGNFEGWTGGSTKNYQLKNNNGVYSITLKNLTKNLLYKFTQGSWKTVECAKDGTAIDNHNYQLQEKKDTIYVKIAGWSHLTTIEEGSTASKNVTILDKEFNIPQLNRKRTIRLFLPKGYTKSDEKYPVIYMHDGQNLFDKETAFSGEWNVDETLNKLYEDKNFKAIVVAIDNGGDKRLDEYSPYKNNKYGGGEGDKYLNFIVNTLKPYIDKNYKTLSDKNNTAIIGSSMGGLISYYAGLRYPKVFGKIGVYSPAFWFAPNIVAFSKQNGNISDSKMYFLVGEKEGVNNTEFTEISQTVNDMNTVVKTIKQQGFPIKNIQTKVVPNGKHNEELWRNNFEETILWLFKDHIKQREFQKASFVNNQLKIKVSDGDYTIRFLNPEITETTFVPKDQKLSKKVSHAVVLHSAFKEVDFKETDKEIILKSNKLVVKIKKSPFNISYWFNGKKLISEKNGYQRNDDFETLQFNLTPTEVLYGAGARALDMNRRGNRLRLYNRAHYGYEETSNLMNFTIPLVLSSNLYAVHFDNAPIGYLDLDSKKNNTLTYETISGRKTYQVIAGNSWEHLINNYTDLTGKQPMLPRWALGNFSSRFGYHSQQETENTIAKFKEEKIPVDAVILDLFWFGKEIEGTMGNLEVYKDSFPDMPKMIKNFKKKGVNTVLITEPFILSTSKKWDEAVAKNVLATDSIGNPARYDFYFGNTGIVDIYNPKGNDWFKNIYKGLLQMGATGMWGDLGEPEVLPSWVNFANGTADEIHNIYGHDWAKLVYETFKENLPNERPFILMRAGYSGSQRYGMVPWSGDVNRTWGGLQSQPKISLQMGMQGLAYMHSDLGGFAGNLIDDELYVRWLQYGVFQPIFRPHAQEEVPSEPIFRSKKAKNLSKIAIELRYKLLPYNYNLVFENHKKGLPLMRPIFFDKNEENNNVYTDAYLWGNDILVAPVLEKGQKNQKVYFPNNSNWFDFYTNKKIKGGQFKTIDLEEDKIPTYVRGGAFIPLSQPIQNTNEYNANTWKVHYYYDNNSNESYRTFYNDDGTTPQAYKKELYEKITFKAKATKYGLKISLKAKIGKHHSHQNKTYTFVIHGLKHSPNKVKIGKRKLNFVWKKESKILKFDVTWNTKTNQKIRIKK